MKIGAHISAAGGVANAPQNAHTIGSEVFQFFSRSPRGGKAPVLTTKQIKNFKANMKEFKQAECYLHAPYYINLASINNRIYYGSISVLREELERGSKLGVKYLMFHPGSAKDLGLKPAIKKVAQGIKEIFKNYTGTTQLLIEISAGSGQIIGDTFEEIASILKLLPVKIRKQVGICYDTAHAFESGYDIRTAQALKKTLQEFDKKIGLAKLKLIHVNDSKTDLGSHVDRHEHLGKGKIGLEGFRAIINEPKLKNINLILETPTTQGVLKDIKLLKKLRAKK